MLRRCGDEDLQLDEFPASLFDPPQPWGLFRLDILFSYCWEVEMTCKRFMERVEKGILSLCIWFVNLLLTVYLVVLK